MLDGLLVTQENSLENQAILLVKQDNVEKYEPVVKVAIRRSSVPMRSNAGSQFGEK